MKIPGYNTGNDLSSLLCLHLYNSIFLIIFVDIIFIINNIIKTSKEFCKNIIC